VTQHARAVRAGVLHSCTRRTSGSGRSEAIMSRHRRTLSRLGRLLHPSTCDEGNRARSATVSAYMLPVYTNGEHDAATAVGFGGSDGRQMTTTYLTHHLARRTIWRPHRYRSHGGQASALLTRVSDGAMAGYVHRPRLNLPAKDHSDKRCPQRPRTARAPAIVPAICRPKGLRQHKYCAPAGLDA